MDHLKLSRPPAACVSLQLIVDDGFFMPNAAVFMMSAGDFIVSAAFPGRPDWMRRILWVSLESMGTSGIQRVNDSI